MLPQNRLPIKPDSSKRFYSSVIINLRIVLLMSLFTGIVSTVVLAADIPEPDGYRLKEYDAPVPDGLQGATTVDAFAVKNLQQQQDALIIDVIPAHRKPKFLPKNQIWIPPAHIGVAGAVWMPDIGYGVLSEVTEAYFTENLSSYTNGDKTKPIVFYCRLDCWMSWNAAKRALTYGYENVYWFANGIDGWQFEDFATESLTVVPGDRQ